MSYWRTSSHSSLSIGAGEYEDNTEEVNSVKVNILIVDMPQERIEIT